MKKITQILLFLFLGLYVLAAQDPVAENDAPIEAAGQYLYAPNQTKKQAKRYFKNLKTFAKAGYAQAHYYIGLYKKEGLGTRKNIRKSKRSLVRAYQLGSSEAAYAIGYYHIKGFGDLPQDYTKAYRWFKKSNTPLATHWMAKMHYLGLGRSSNKAKALKLLLNNDLYNSAVLALQYQNNEPPAVGISPAFQPLVGDRPLQTIHGLEHLHKTPVAVSLAGSWQGEYLELDWSKQKIFRSLPVQLSLEATRKDRFLAQLQLGDSVASATSHYSAGNLRFNNLAIPVKKQYTDYPNFTHLMVDVDGLTLREVPYNGERYLVGRLDAAYPIWQERANPGIVLLKRQNVGGAEAQAAFLEQKNDFIKLFPNPFEAYLLINFELPEDADVKVEITHYYNTPLYEQTVFEGRKASGEHTLEVYDLPTYPGTYLVTITYNGTRATKIILKNEP